MLGPSARNKVYEAFMTLCQIQESADKLTDLRRICDDGIQLALRQWHGMPTIVSQSHTPILHIFQQYVELQEASHIYLGVAPANSMPNKIQSMQSELKGTLGTWRDRLPNHWDDINIWSELVAWRQHVFGVINKSNQPMTDQQPGGNTLAYRGFHEIAWIINRFAHVARKHGLINVCISALTKIYTLPNIEIHDAFLKLREQAKCYVNNKAELATGLEVINNTNLGYFQQSQRAEFFALKGIFLSRMGLHEDANQAFSSALQIDVNLGKAWSAWGRYNDAMFKAKPDDYQLAANAINSYLNAVSLYKNARCRKYLARALWLLSQDDATGTIAKSFESYKGDMSPWYWITSIPQLISGLSRGEARHAKHLLIRIAKSFPQALYFALRTARQDLEENAGVAQLDSMLVDDPMADMDNDNPVDVDQGVADRMNISIPSEPFAAPEVIQIDINVGGVAQLDSAMSVDGKTDSTYSLSRRSPTEHVEEIMAILKTAYPLLALSMETMVDQILSRMKPSAQETVYRSVSALYADGYQQLIDGTALGVDFTNSNIRKSMVSTAEQNSGTAQFPAVVGLIAEYYLDQLVFFYGQWRDNLEVFLNSRPKKQRLEHLSHYLVEFEYQKFDDVEVPGQYLQLRDTNADFIKIDRFAPEVQLIAGDGVWYRRIEMIGHDGSVNSFMLQNPAPSTARREERIIQTFRVLDSVLMKRKESRRRHLNFHLPAMIPLASNARLVQDDSSYTSLQDVYVEHCRRTGQARDAPMELQLNAVKNAIQHRGRSFETAIPELINLRVDCFEKVTRSLVPNTILSDSLSRSAPSATDYWLLRKNFTCQLAAVTFMTHAVQIGNRLPHRMMISRTTGNIWLTEIHPAVDASTMEIINNELVPFRLTPNLQQYVTPVGMEGPLLGCVVAIASSLMEPDFLVEEVMSTYVQDELYSSVSGQELKNATLKNVTAIVKRVSNMSNTPSVVELISQATNTHSIGSMDASWQPWQ